MKTIIFSFRTSPDCVLQLLQAGRALGAARRPPLSVRRLLRPTWTQFQLLHLTLQLLHLCLQVVHSFCQPAWKNKYLKLTGTIAHRKTFMWNFSRPSSYPWIFCCAVLLSWTSLWLLCSSSRADTSSCSYTLACWSLTCLRRSTCFVRYWQREKGDNIKTGAVWYCLVRLL